MRKLYAYTAKWIGFKNLHYEQAVIKQYRLYDSTFQKVNKLSDMIEDTPGGNRGQKREKQVL